jgi:hypothetical protein
MQHVRIGLTVAFISGLMSAQVHAADNPNSFRPSSVPASMQRDPFTTSDKMYGEIGIQAAQKAGAQQGFVPGYGAQNVPKMRLKGYVTKGKNQSTALLEIDGAGVYMVSKGDEIGLHAIGQNTVLKIVDVGQNGVKVQSGQVNQVIVVR